MDTQSIYLDYNATTPLDPQVITAITDAMENAWGNPSSSYEAGQKAKAIINSARKNLALMVGAPPTDIVFSSGGTEANNQILNTALKYFHSENQKHNIFPTTTIPHVVTSNLEHDSIKLVLKHFHDEGLADISYVKASPETGRVEVEDIVSAIRPTTCMISVMAANNETGVIQPVAEICERVRNIRRKVGEIPRILLHTDAAQVIGKIPISMETLGVDYLTIVGHKFYGPRIGALCAKGLGSYSPLYPMFYGGGQERNFRPGTENTPMIAGLGKAAELVVENITRYEDHMREIRDYLEEQLQDEFGDQVTFNGRFEGSERIPNTSNVSFIGDGLEGHSVLSQCSRLKASIGAACHAQNRPSPILLSIGISEDIAKNALRLSVGRTTSKTDIDEVISDLKHSIKTLLFE